MVPLSAYAKDYNDLDQSSKFYKAISVLTSEGILQGYPDGSFKPEQPINRAEALKVILLAFPKAEGDLPVNKFPDVQESDWFYNYVRTALKHGIIQGYVDGTFKPANQVIFAESLKMGLEAKGVKKETLTFSPFHRDIKESDWFAPYFSFAYSKNLYDLDMSGGITPQKPYTRGEFMELIYRIKAWNVDDKFDISYNWEEETSPDGFKVLIPFNWDSFDLGGGMYLAFFGDGKPNFVRNIENSAKVAFTIWTNPDGLSSTEYFANIRSDYTAKNPGIEVNFADKKLQAGQSLLVMIPQNGTIDLYVYLSDKSVLAAHGYFDNKSAKQSDLEKEIYKIYEKLETGSESGILSPTKKLQNLRANINKLNKGQESLKLFTNIDLFNTDTIGVGTGPVDYYYVKEINHSLKIERNADVLLDILEGKTSAF